MAARKVAPVKVAPVKVAPVSAWDRISNGPTITETIGAAPSQPQPRADAIPDELVRGSYIVGRDLRDRLNASAAAESVVPSDIVRYLIETWLTDQKAGGEALVAAFRKRLVQPTARYKLR